MIGMIKKYAKKILAGSLAVVLATGTLSGIGQVKATDTTSDFQMRAGASIRVSKEAGIRYAVEIDGDVKAELFDSDNKLRENVEVGMLIVPKQILDAVSTTDGTDYLKMIEQTYGKKKEDIATIFRADQFRTENGKKVATAAIINIKDMNYTRQWQAVAFYTTDSGATYHYTAKSDARCIGYVADQALADTSNYSGNGAKIMGELVERHIQFTRANDLSYELLNGQTVDLFQTYANGLDSTKSKITFAVKNQADNVELDGNTLKAVKEGNATILMKGYGDLVDLELPVTTGENYKAAFTGTNVYYSANNTIKADVITKEQLDSYEGSKPLVIAGRLATMKASLKIAESEWENGMVITVYGQMNMTKQRVKELLDAGYDKLVVPYYLHADSTSGVAICGCNYTPWNVVTNDTWSELVYDLKTVYNDYDKINGTGGENFFLRLNPNSAGLYELYIGECEVTTTNPVPTPSQAGKVISLIDALPNVENLTLEHEAQVESAKAAYEALSEKDKAKVSNADKLNACVEKIKELQGKKDAVPVEYLSEPNPHFDYYSDNTNNAYAGATIKDVTHEGKVAKWYATVNIAQQNGGYLRAYQGLDLTVAQLKEYQKQGYTHLRIPYYLTVPEVSGKTEIHIHNDGWEWNYKKGADAEIGQWTYFDYSLNDLLLEPTTGKTVLDGINSVNGAYGLMNIEVKAIGTYTLYLGECELLKPEVGADVEVTYATEGRKGFDYYDNSSNGDWQGAQLIEGTFEGKNYEWKSSQVTVSKSDGTGYLRAYSRLNITKAQLESYKEQGYTHLRIPYYLVASETSTKQLQVNNGDEWSYKTIADVTHNQWANFEYPIDDLIANIEGINQGGSGGYALFNIKTSGTGTYTMYLGQATLITSAQAASFAQPQSARAIADEWKIFKNLTSVYGSIKGEQTLGVEADNEEPVTGDAALYRTGGTIEGKYAKGGSVKLYTPFSILKDDLKTWMDAGYDKLEVPYFVEANNEYGVHVYASDESQYSQATIPGVWNKARLDLQYLYENYEKLALAKGDNYLLRVELKKAGTYAVYLGGCKPMADTIVTVQNGICLGWDNTNQIGYNGNLEYDIKISDIVKDKLTIDGQAAEWSGKISIPSEKWNATEPVIQIGMKPKFTKAQVDEWIASGLTGLQIPYYIKATETGNYSFAEGIGWSWSQEATANTWSTVTIPLSYIQSNYDKFENVNWCFALYIPNYGEYELFFGEGEVVGDTTSEKTVAQVVKPGNTYYWGSDGEGAGSYETNVSFHDRIAESVATINEPGNQGVITFYYTLGVSKAQVQKWIDAGYTTLKIPYYLEGNASHIYGQFDDTYETKLHWKNYCYSVVQAGVWTEFTIPLDALLIRYDAIQNPGGEKYLFRIQPSEAGTLKMAIGQCGVYKETTVETKAVKTYTDTATATSSKLVTNGASEYEILIPSNAGSKLRVAATELQTFLKEATGAELPIVTKTSKPYISLGDTKQLKAAGLSVASDVKGTEGFQINTVDGNIYIYADSDLGVAYGVYGYLERTLDFDYFFQGVYNLKKEATTPVYNLNVTDVPDFKTRIASYNTRADFGGWLSSDTEQLRMRMETYTEHMTGATKDGVVYAFHNSLNYLPASQYQANHSAWYVTENGEVKQLCYNAGGDSTSRSKMVNLVAENMFDTLTTAKYQSYNKIVFAAEDNEVWCTCNACKQDEACYGAKSASLVRFCNEVAAQLEKLLRAAGDDRAESFQLVMYAYNATEEAPVLCSTLAEGEVTYSYRPEMRLNYHIAPMYAPIKADFSRSFTADTNAKYLENLKKWKVIANDVYMEAYDSFFNNRGYLLPYNSWDSLQSLYQTAYENGVVWFYNLGQENNSVSSGFSLLKAYLESKLAWDVNADVAKLTDNFFEAMYGNQADAVKGVYTSIKTHMNGLTAENFWPQVNSTHRKNDGHFKDGNWPKATLTSWLSNLQTIETTLTSSGDTEAAKRVRLEEMYVLSLLMETYYVKTDTTEIDGTFWGIGDRKYNTSDSNFKEYREKFTSIVTEWNIQNAAENDWTMENYLKGLNN